MSEFGQRYMTAQICHVEIIPGNPDDDCFIVIGYEGKRHLDGWRRTKQWHTIAIFTTLEDAVVKVERLEKLIERGRGFFPKTVPRELSSYLLP